MRGDTIHSESEGAVVVEARAMEVLDSRGNPTLETEVVLSCGARGRAAAPAGASTGSREAAEMRDGGARYGGKGVRRAMENVRALAEAVAGIPAARQRDIDEAMQRRDGTADKSNLGANAIISVSLACAKAAAKSRGLPLYRHLYSLPRPADAPPQNGRQRYRLPAPMLNVINGGAHANNGLDIQEFMIMPSGFADFSTALRAGVEVFHALGGLLESRGLSTANGDEGGFAPRLPGNEAALELLVKAVERAGYRPGEEVFLALDCAANELARKEKSESKNENENESERECQYRLPADNFCGGAEEFSSLLAEWAKKYPIVSIEDGCAEDDWHGWEILTRKLGELQLVGDDLFVTDSDLLRRGAERGAANALLVKPNQSGTLTGAMDAAFAAQAAGYNAVVSHRSGETEHSEIADIAVALNAGQIKTGAPARGERTAKYNRLLRIAGELGEDAIFGGDDLPKRILPARSGSSSGEKK